MAVEITDLVLYQCATRPLSFSTSNVGGAASATPITGGSIGEVHFPMASLATGEGNNVQYSKCCAQNDHSTDDADSVKFYILNALTTWGSANYVTVAFATAPTDLKARVVGFLAGVEYAEEFTVNATSTNSPSQTDDLQRIEFRNGSTSALEGVAGDATIKNSSTTIGICPGPIVTSAGTIPGRYTATGEIAIGLHASLDDSATITDASTAPGSVTFSTIRTLATALSVGSGGTIAAGSYQSIWSRLTAKERVKTSSDVQVVLAMRIEAS